MPVILDESDSRFPQFAKRNFMIKWKVFLLPDNKTVEVQFPTGHVKFRSDCETCLKYAGLGSDAWPSHAAPTRQHPKHCACDWCF